MKQRLSVRVLGFLATSLVVMAYAVLVLLHTPPRPRPLFLEDRDSVLASYPFLQGQYGNAPVARCLTPSSRVFIALHLACPPLILTTLHLESRHNSPFATFVARRLVVAHSSPLRSSQTWLQDAWRSDARFLLQALFLCALWWAFFPRLLPRLQAGLRAVRWRSLPRRAFRRLPLVLPLGLTLAALAAALDLDGWLDARARREILLEAAERGRQRAMADINAGVLTWPSALHDRLVVAELCRLYGVDAAYAPYYYPNESSCIVFTRPVHEAERSTYAFFMRANVERVVSQDDFAYLIHLSRLATEFEWVAPPPVPANPGMQRTRYARR